MTTYRFTESDAGCWVAGSAHNTADEISAATILWALEHGMVVDPELVAICRSLGGWCEDPDDSQWLSDVGWDAVQYLSSLCPDGYYFTFDDGLVMYANDDDGF